MESYIEKSIRKLRDSTWTCSVCQVTVKYFSKHQHCHARKHLEKCSETNTDPEILYFKENKIGRKRTNEATKMRYPLINVKEVKEVKEVKVKPVEVEKCVSCKRESEIKHTITLESNGVKKDFTTCDHPRCIKKITINFFKL